MLTKPSAPRVASNTGRKHVGRFLNILDRELFENLGRPSGRAPCSMRAMASSYSSEWPMACSKIDGFEVTPRKPSSSTSFFSPPLAMKPRDTKSSHTAWP